MKKQQDLTDEEIEELNEEIEELNREAEIAEMKPKYNEHRNWLEENGYEEGGDGDECPGNNGGHNVKLWYNPKTKDIVEDCPFCEHFDHR
jgi:G3E family GTPase